MCRKYCPQEVTMANYNKLKDAPRVMSLDNFKKILQNTPKTVTIRWAAFSEPFDNPNCMDMLEYAYSNGYKLDLFTTLSNTTQQDIDRLVKLKFGTFVLHLPDGQVFSVPTRNRANYSEALVKVLHAIPNVQVMSMHQGFATNNREDVTRKVHANQPVERKPYQYCPKFHTCFAPVAIPNGNVYLCCMDFGLSHYLGNLIEEKYEDLRTRTLFNEGKFDLCSMCEYNGNQPSITFERKIRNRIARVAQASKVRILRK